MNCCFYVQLVAYDSCAPELVLDIIGHRFYGIYLGIHGSQATPYAVTRVHLVG